jgi:hypothetical protein
LLCSCSIGATVGGFLTTGTQRALRFDETHKLFTCAREPLGFVSIKALLRCAWSCPFTSSGFSLSITAFAAPAGASSPDHCVAL